VRNVEGRIQTRVLGRETPRLHACLLRLTDRAMTPRPPPPHYHTLACKQTACAQKCHEYAIRLFVYIRQEGLSPTVMRGIEGYCS
jgi:hypothetical protein